MDLRSYIELKEAYKKMHSPEETISEEVEAVEEEILSEEELQENPNTWNNPLGQISRTATKMFGNADQIKGVKQNEKDIKDREDAVFRDGGGNAKQREFEKQGYLSGQARRAVMNQGDRNRAQTRRQQSSSSSSSSSSSYDPRPGGGARDDLKAAQNAGNKGAKGSTQGSGNNGGSSGSSGSSQSASSSQRSSQPASSSSSSSQRSSQPASSSSSSQPAAKTTPPKVKQTGDKKTDMAAWAKANPKLAAAQKKREATRGTSASSNPLMKGLGRPAPKAAPKAAAPKAAPSAGAKAAMNAAPMSRIAKATSNVKALSKLNNSVDMSEFDIILEHLVESGFAVDEALKVMVNMSEEKREQIISERSREFTDARRAQNAAGERGPEFVGPAKAETRNMQNASGARGPEFVGPAKAALGQKPDNKVKKPGAGNKGMSPTMKEETVEEGMHREADTGKVVDKAEVGKTYYPNMEKKKSSVALRKEKEAAEKRKTRKESDESLMAAYRAVYEPREEISEEESDALKDRRMERGGVDGNNRYDKAPKAPNTKKFGSGKTMAQKEMEKKYGKGASAMDIVRADLEKKYGKGAILGGKKKKEDKKD